MKLDELIETLTVSVLANLVSDRIAKALDERKEKASESKQAKAEDRETK